MPKYERLTDYLGSLSIDLLTLDFDELEQILGFDLPKSARRYPAWWANERRPSHSHIGAWIDAGWQTERVNLRRGSVAFRRSASVEKAAEERWLWPAPSIRRLAGLFSRGHAAFDHERAERYREILQEFGPPGDMLLLGGISAMFALREMQWTYVDGHFLATVLTAQVLVEQSLGSTLILAGEDAAAESGLSGILNRLVALDWIETEQADRLRELQKMRIAYGHAHVGLKARSLMTRLMARRTVPEELVEEDARFAVQIISDWLRSQQPERTPSNPKWKEAVREAYGKRAS